MRVALIFSSIISSHPFAEMMDSSFNTTFHHKVFVCQSRQTGWSRISDRLFPYAALTPWLLPNCTAFVNDLLTHQPTTAATVALYFGFNLLITRWHLAFLESAFLSLRVNIASICIVKHKAHSRLRGEYAWMRAHANTETHTHMMQRKWLIFIILSGSDRDPAVFLLKTSCLTGDRETEREGDTARDGIDDVI